MSVSSLRQTINGNFVTGLQRRSKPAKTGLSALKSDANSLPTSLRTGARNLAAGIQALNVSVTYVNLSRQVHEKLLDVVTKLDLVVAKSSREGVGSQTSAQYQFEFQAFNKEFQDIIKKAKIQGSDILDVNTLTEVMIRSGIDPEKSDELKGAVDKIEPLTGSSEKTAQSVDSLIPVNSFSSAIRRVTAAFAEASATEGEELSLDVKSTFREVRDQLESVREKLEGNIKALNKAVEVVGDNMKVARAAGFALLELSEEVKGNEDPEIIASKIRDRIRRDASSGLSQAGNLNSIIVAGLTLNSDTFKSLSKK